VARRLVSEDVDSDSSTESEESSKDTTISVPGNQITGDIPQGISSEVPEDIPF
jgi:hypothetical protein